MRSAILGFVAGCLLLQWQPTLPSASLVFLLVLAAVLLLALVWRWRLHKWSALLLLSAGAVLGFAWAAFMANQALKPELPKAWEGRDMVLVGTVSSLPTQFDRGLRFQFSVEEVFLDGEKRSDFPEKIALSWYRGFGEEDKESVPSLQPGERWQLSVRLKRPHGTANPYGFDLEVWMLEQGVRATGYVRTDSQSFQENVRRDVFVWRFQHMVHRVRGMLRDQMQDALGDKRYANVLIALVIGEQGAINRDDWLLFTRTGVSHLISISGLHITMIAGMMAALMSALWRRSFFTRAQLPLLLPAQKVAALTGATVALVYVFLAGFGVPAQRTLYMLLVVAAALWCDRLTSVSHVLLLALGCVVFLDPWAVLWPGFWLSFCAVGVILYASVGRASHAAFSEKTRMGRWKASLILAARTQYAVTLGLVPLTLLLFGQVSLVGPVANALAIPVVSLMVTPLALIGSVLPAPLSAFVLMLAHGVFACLVEVLHGLSQFSFAVWSAPIPSAGLFLFALLGTIWMLAPKGWPARWLGLCCWLPLALNTASHPAEKEAWISVFDVGQGSAILIETQQHRLLYDTGPKFSAESDAGSRIILPYLRGRGIHTLDALIVTHQDSDHAGGASSILKAGPFVLCWARMWKWRPIVRRQNDTGSSDSACRRSTFLIFCFHLAGGNQRQRKGQSQQHEDLRISR